MTTKNVIYKRQAIRLAIQLVALVTIVTVFLLFRF